jgi:hypothetical protein
MAGAGIVGLALGINIKICPIGTPIGKSKFECYPAFIQRFIQIPLFEI